MPHLLDDPWLKQSQGGETARQWGPALAVVGSPGTVVAGCLRSRGCLLPFRAEPDSVVTRLASRARTSFLRKELFQGGLGHAFQGPWPKLTAACPLQPSPVTGWHPRCTTRMWAQMSAAPPLPLEPGDLHQVLGAGMTPSPLSPLPRTSGTGMTTCPFQRRGDSDTSSWAGSDSWGKSGSKLSPLLATLYYPEVTDMGASVSGPHCLESQRNGGPRHAPKQKLNTDYMLGASGSGPATVGLWSSRVVTHVQNHTQ